MSGQKPIVLFNYACHGVSLGGGNLEISADWIGAARNVLESSGSVGSAMFLQGCCGNINPRTGGSFENVRLAGESVAKPLLDALASAKPIENPRLKIAWKDVQLPYARCRRDGAGAGDQLPPGEIEKVQAEGQPFVHERCTRRCWSGRWTRTRW